jgi:formate hydrogenlyase subunit 4
MNGINGYSIIFTAVFIVILAATAGALSWGIIRGTSALAHHRRGHRRS